MRESPEIEKTIRLYTGALMRECNTLKEADTRRTPLFNGILLSSSEDGCVYRFETEAEQYLSDGTPVTVYTKNGKVEGTVLDCSGFDLTVQLTAEIPALGAEMSSSPWYLLQDLSAALEKLIKSSYENELYAELIERRQNGLKEDGKIAMGQDTAYTSAMERPITFIWGPPGTGKTYTLAQIAYAFYKKGISTLILSQSNVAVDCAVLELSKNLGKKDEGKVLRYGSYRKKEMQETEIVLSSYDLALKRSPELMKAREELNYRRQTATFSDAGEIEKRSAALKDSVHMKEQALVYEAKVVGATLSRAVVSEAIFHRKFGAVLVDEASMCFVPQVIYAASLATDRLVVVGDFRQLPPIVADPAAKPVLTRDIFRFLGIPHGKKVFYHPWLVLLDEQRRMHPEIAGFVSREVYGGLLRSAPGMEEKREKISALFPFEHRATAMLDLTDTYNVCGRTADGSRFNLLSALFTAAIAQKEAEAGAKLAIVTPYVSQVRLYRALLYDLKLTDKVVVSSVHQFQGSETDAVLFDTVDFLRQNRPGYLLSKETEEDDVALRLINVALTRARGKFVLVTNARYFGGKLPENATLKNLIANLKERGAAAGAETVKEGVYGGMRITWSEDNFSDVMESATESADLFLPAATYDEELAKTLYKALERAKKRGVTVRVYTEDPEITGRDFPGAAVTEAAIFPLLVIDGKTVIYDPLYCTEWKNTKWTSRFPVSVSLFGAKTAETVQALVRSMGKLSDGTGAGALFGLKEDCAGKDEITAREAYSCACFLSGLADNTGMEGYFSLMKTLKKQYSFRFVKTALGAECCFKKKELWEDFFLRDFSYGAEIGRRDIKSPDELREIAEKFYGGERND